MLGIQLYSFFIHVVLDTERLDKAMHKSYQSTRPSANRLLQKKWDDKYYSEHRLLVNILIEKQIVSILRIPIPQINIMKYFVYLRLKTTESIIFKM